LQIRCHQLAVEFPGSEQTVQAIRNINFETRHGEFLVIVGPSGCGQTTLLRTVAGLLQPTQGTVEKIRLPGETNGNVRLVFQENSLSLG